MGSEMCIRDRGKAGAIDEQPGKAGQIMIPAAVNGQGSGRAAGAKEEDGAAGAEGRIADLYALIDRNAGGSLMLINGPTPVLR